MQVKADHFLWTGIDTQIAAFAVEFIDFNPSLYGHSLTSNKRTHNQQDDIYYLHYQYINDLSLVLTVTDLLYISPDIIGLIFIGFGNHGLRSTRVLVCMLPNNEAMKPISYSGHATGLQIVNLRFLAAGHLLPTCA
jgi:hypothetical protein